MAAPRHATEQLAKHQVQSILHQYIENFIEYVADERQRAQPWTRNKSRVEAMLRNLTGSAMMAKLIWQVGLPDISEAECWIKQERVLWNLLPATEQPRPLNQSVQDAIAAATVTIQHWLSKLANSIQEHKATDAYQEHARKSGTQKHTSGLNETELAIKQEKRREPVSYTHLTLPTICSV